MFAGLLLFGGPIGSGKSTLAALAAKRLGCERVSFSAALLEIAAKHGLRPNRSVLQNLGQKVVAEEPEALIRTVLTRGNWVHGRALVIDGIRHRSIFDRLRADVAPDRVCLIYVKAHPELRRARVLREEGLDRLALWESHKVESEIPDLEAVADRVITNNDTLAEASRTLNLWLDQVEAATR
jgi:dephospho-CoA kinase